MPSSTPPPSPILPHPPGDYLEGLVVQALASPGRPLPLPDLTQAELAEWLAHPATRRLLAKVQARKEALLLGLLSQAHPVEVANHRAGQALVFRQMEAVLSDRQRFLEF